MQRRSSRRREAVSRSRGGDRDSRAKRSRYHRRRHRQSLRSWLCLSPARCSGRSVAELRLLLLLARGSRGRETKTLRWRRRGSRCWGCRRRQRQRLLLLRLLLIVLLPAPPPLVCRLRNVVERDLTLGAAHTRRADGHSEDEQAGEVEAAAAAAAAAAGLLPTMKSSHSQSLGRVQVLLHSSSALLGMTTTSMAC